MIYFLLSVLILIGLVNTVLLVAISRSVLKFLALFHKGRIKMARDQLVDLPFRQEGYPDYGDAVMLQNVSPEVRLLRDK